MVTGAMGEAMAEVMGEAMAEVTVDRQNSNRPDLSR
jgi:predicted dinucleotide-binding enzyme